MHEIRVDHKIIDNLLSAKEVYYYHIENTIYTVCCFKGP